MSSMHTLIRQKNLMTEPERTELLASGWHPKVVESLADRGFRPCKPDIIAARSGDFDLHNSLGFLRQTATPHLYITIAKDELTEVVMERIDSAIYECGHRHGHEHVAGLFMRFFDQCKHWQPAPSTADLEKRLAVLEAANAQSRAPVVMVPENEFVSTKYWCAMCGKWGDHQSGICPQLHSPIPSPPCKSPHASAPRD